MAQKDRRAHPRFRVWVPARIEGEAQPSRLAVGHDMSQSGSLLVTMTKLNVGDRVHLYVRLPPDGDQELELEAHVLRSDVNAADPNGLWPYRAAVAFDAPKPDLEAVLREHSALLEGVAEASNDDDDEG